MQQLLTGIAFCFASNFGRDRLVMIAKSGKERQAGKLMALGGSQFPY
jgi:hypothetical protein